MDSRPVARVVMVLLAVGGLAMAAGCAAAPNAATMDAAVLEARGFLRQQLLSADNPVVRSQAIEGMQTSPWPGATRYIEHALNDPYRGVRFAAAMALGKLRDQDSGDLLQRS